MVKEQEITNDIIIPNGVKYLSEVMSGLPDNCIFDKSIVGCGGTTIALTCPDNYVICVPFVSLIQNKIGQHNVANEYPYILGVYKETKVKDIKSYIENNHIAHKKIMVTYDSLYKLEKYINPKNYKLLVDEYHLLFNCYSFRNKAVKDVLNLYTKYKSYCFMTATLLEREFILTELKDIPIITARWNTIKEVTVHSVKCEANVIHTVANLVKEYLSGEREGNAYFFVNSVEFIKTLIDSCNLTDDNTRAIWSNNNKTQTGLKRGSTEKGTHKKINLLTSTCFEGADLYDPEGQIYIISDGNKSHTIVDISTSFQQIAGRIRDTKFKDTITHIYNQTRYSVDISYDEYKVISDKQSEKNKKIANTFPSLDSDMRDQWITMQRKLEKESNYDCYLRMNGEELVYDENMAKIDLYNFKVTNSIYKIRINLAEEYRKNGYNVEISNSKSKDIVIIKPKKNFKETVIEMRMGDSDVMLQAFKQYPFLHEAIEKIGYQGIEDAKYSITGVKRKIIKLSAGSDRLKILQSLKTSSYIYDGAFVESNTLKKLLGSIYKDLGLQLTPKANDVSNYFYVKEHIKRVKVETIIKGCEVSQKKSEWKSCKGYVIIKSKF